MMTAGQCLTTKQPIKRSLPGRSRGSLMPRMDGAYLCCRIAQTRSLRMKAGNATIAAGGALAAIRLD